MRFVLALLVAIGVAAVLFALLPARRSKSEADLDESLTFIAAFIWGLVIYLVDPA